MLAAYYMGIPVKRVLSLIWAISAAVAACAGVLLAPIAFIHTNVGLALGLKAFPAAVLGGFGSHSRRAGRRRHHRRRSKRMPGFYLPEGWKDVAPTSSCSWCCCCGRKGCSACDLRKKV